MHNISLWVWAYKSTKEDLSYGNNIEWSFTISNKNVIDSTGLERETK